MSESKKRRVATVCGCHGTVHQVDEMCPDCQHETIERGALHRVALEARRFLAELPPSHGVFLREALAELDKVVGE